jgi:tetratricopeptide (TPR) repeat protein
MLSALLLLGAALVPAQSDDLAAKSAQAKQLMASGRFEEAIPIYREMVKAMPGNPGPLFNLGLALHMAGREKEAIPNLQAVLKAQPDVLPALVTLGAAHLALNQPAEAIEPLRKALAVQPNDTDTRGMLAGALLEAKRLDEAGVEYRKLADASPQDPRAWYGLGMTYQATATADFEQLQKAGATSPYVSALVAETRVQRRQFRSGFFFYNEAAKQLPGLHGIHSALADVYRKTGHADWAAEEDAKEGALPAADCTAHPAECQFAGGHDLQILTQAHRGTLSAEALYWRVKAANELAMQALFRLGQLPASVELHQLRAEIARSQGKHLESVSEWRQALALAPGNPGIRRELATSLFLAQDYQPALSEAEPLLKADPKSAELNFLVGDSRLRLEQPEQAVAPLKAALATDPKLLAADASLGLALSRLGNYAEAVPHLEKAIELDEDGSLYYQLARAYQALGQREKASGAMVKYQEILKRVEQQKKTWRARRRSDRRGEVGSMGGVLLRCCGVVRRARDGSDSLPGCGGNGGCFVRAGESSNRTQAHDRDDAGGHRRLRLRRRWAAGHLLYEWSGDSIVGEEVAAGLEPAVPERGELEVSRCDGGGGGRRCGLLDGGGGRGLR